MSVNLNSEIFGPMFNDPPPVSTYCQRLYQLMASVVRAVVDFFRRIFYCPVHSVISEGVRYVPDFSKINSKEVLLMLELLDAFEFNFQKNTPFRKPKDLARELKELSDNMCTSLEQFCDKPAHSCERENHLTKAQIQRGIRSENPDSNDFTGLLVQEVDRNPKVYALFTHIVGREIRASLLDPKIFFKYLNGTSSQQEVWMEVQDLPVNCLYTRIRVTFLNRDD